MLWFITLIIIIHKLQAYQYHPYGLYQWQQPIHSSNSIQWQCPYFPYAFLCSHLNYVYTIPCVIDSQCPQTQYPYKCCYDACYGCTMCKPAIHLHFPSPVLPSSTIMPFTTFTSLISTTMEDETSVTTEKTTTEEMQSTTEEFTTRTEVSTTEEITTEAQIITEKTTEEEVSSTTEEFSTTEETTTIETTTEPYVTEVSTVITTLSNSITTFQYDSNESNENDYSSTDYENVTPN